MTHGNEERATIKKHAVAHTRDLAAMSILAILAAPHGNEATLVIDYQQEVAAF